LVGAAWRALFDFNIHFLFHPQSSLINHESHSDFDVSACFVAKGRSEGSKIGELTRNCDEYSTNETALSQYFLNKTTVSTPFVLPKESMVKSVQ
jgi:hypothetical protein